MNDWLRSIPSVTATVDCGGAVHHVSWRRGKVVLHDHLLREERVVVALGGAQPQCLRLLEEWRKGAAWAAATRPPPPGFIRRIVPAAVPEPLAEVRRLGVVRSWDRRWRRNGPYEEAEDLYRFIRRRALPPLTEAVHAARRRLRGGRVNYVEVRLAEPDLPPEVAGRIDRHRSSMVVTLGPSWVYDVWSTGSALVGDADFVISPGQVVAWELVAAADNAWEPRIVSAT